MAAELVRDSVAEGLGKGMESAVGESAVGELALEKVAVSAWALALAPAPPTLRSDRYWMN